MLKNVVTSSVAAVILCAQQAGVSAQNPVVRQFSAASAIFQYADEDGDLKATHSRTGDELTIAVKRIPGRATDSGWAGVCIENDTSMNLTGFTNVAAVIEPS